MPFLLESLEETSSNLVYTKHCTKKRNNQHFTLESEILGSSSEALISAFRRRRSPPRVSNTYYLDEKNREIINEPVDVFRRIELGVGKFSMI